MDRTVYLTLGGKEYPMRFSLGASMKISEKYGSLSKMSDALVNTDEKKALDTIADIVELLIHQGCAYKNLFEKDMPVPENAPVAEGKYVGLTKEDLYLAIEFSDIPELRTKIMQAIVGGEKSKILTQEKGKEKNAETA